MIGRTGNTTDVVKRTHQCGGTGFYACFIRWQIGFPQRLVRDVRISVIASPFRFTISHKMFKACCYRKAIGQIFTLIPFDGCYTKNSIGIRIFAIAFGNTSPTWIAGNINHRRESPVDTGEFSFFCGKSCSLGNQGRIPRTSLCQ